MGFFDHADVGLQSVRAGCVGCDKAYVGGSYYPADVRHQNMIGSYLGRHGASPNLVGSLQGHGFGHPSLVGSYYGDGRHPNLVGAAHMAVGGTVPGSEKGFWNKLADTVSASKFDPATLWGFPQSAPPEWTAASPTGAHDFAMYTEGVQYGAARGGLTMGVVGAALGVLGSYLYKKYA